MFEDVDMFIHLNIMQNMYVPKHHMALHKYGHFLLQLENKKLVKSHSSNCQLQCNCFKRTVFYACPQASDETELRQFQEAGASVSDTELSAC